MAVHDVSALESFLEVLLLHLIKQEAERKTTRSWDYSISNSLWHIDKTNKRRKAGGSYLDIAEIKDMIDEVYPEALKRAALETLEGRYETDELDQMVNANQIKEKAFQMIQKTPN